MLEGGKVPLFQVIFYPVIEMIQLSLKDMRKLQAPVLLFVFSIQDTVIFKNRKHNHN